MRRLVVANWKMNTLLPEARALVQAILPVPPGPEVVLCPPLLWLTELARLLEGSGVALGAQNVHYQDGGAFTGEVSPRMLRGLCQYVLVGQYERRILFDERDAQVRRKLAAARQHGLKPILCVGETAEQLADGLGQVVVAEQLEAGLEGAPLDDALTVAYEPVWTTMGRVMPPPWSYAAEMAAHIRQTLQELGSAEGVRVIYGGSVNPRTIATIAAEPLFDGVLAGSASVNASDFLQILQVYSSA